LASGGRQSITPSSGILNGDEPPTGASVAAKLANLLPIANVAFCVWVCVSNGMGYRIFRKRLNHFSIAVPQLCCVAIYLVTHS